MRQYYCLPALLMNVVPWHPESDYTGENRKNNVRKNDRERSSHDAIRNFFSFLFIFVVAFSVTKANVDTML